MAHHYNTILQQLTSLSPRRSLEKLVKAHHNDQISGSFNPLTQFFTTMIVQVPESKMQLVDFTTTAELYH